MARTDPTTIAPDKLGHRTRYSDSSFYDEVCVLCGANDGDGRLSTICSKPMAGDLETVTLRLTQVMVNDVVMTKADAEAFKSRWDLARGECVSQLPLPQTSRIIQTTATVHNLAQVVGPDV